MVLPQRPKGGALPPGDDGIGGSHFPLGGVDLSPLTVGQATSVLLINRVHAGPGNPWKSRKVNISIKSHGK